MLAVEQEYESIRRKHLTDEAQSSYLNGKAFLHEHVTHCKTFQVDKGADLIINESNEGSPPAFFLTHKQAGARDSEKFVESGITSVNSAVDGIPKKLHSKA